MGELIPEQEEGAGFKGVRNMFFFFFLQNRQIGFNQFLFTAIVQYSCGCHRGLCRNCRARKLASMDSFLFICRYVSIDKKEIVDSFVPGLCIC